MASQRTNKPICPLVASAEDCAATARYSITRHDGDTFRAVYFRAVYTVRFETAVHVLHAFQKKAGRGIATPKQALDLGPPPIARRRAALP